MSKLPIHQILKQIELDDFLWNFDAVSLCPFAMWDETSIYLTIETGYAYRKYVNDEVVEKFASGDFNRGRAIIKIKLYKPKNLIVQHLPVKEKVNKIEINCMRNDYIIDTLTSVVICKIVKSGGKVIEISKGVVYQRNFWKTPFKKNLLVYLLSNRSIRMKITT